jgi:hypothetical protein
MMKSNVDPVQDDSALTLKKPGWKATTLVANSIVSMTRIPENTFMSSDQCNDKTGDMEDGSTVTRKSLNEITIVYRSKSLSLQSSSRSCNGSPPMHQMMIR